MSNKKHQSRHSIQTARFQPLNTKVLWVAIGILLTTMTISKISGDDDAFWHLATGRWIVQHKTVPSVDVFSYPLPHQPWIPFEWGWDVLTYILYASTNSYLLLYLLMALIWLGICGLIMVTMRRLQISTPILVLTILFTVVTSLDRMTPRPHVITLLGLAATLYCYVKFRYASQQSATSLFFLPIIFFLWANLHPGVIGGFFLLVLIILSEIFLMVSKRRATAISRSAQLPLDLKTFAGVGGIFLLSIVVTLINPHGINTFRYVYAHTQLTFLTLVDEWLPPFGGAYESSILTLYKINLGLGVLSLIYFGKKRDPFPAILSVGFALYSLRAVRFIADFALVSSLGIALGGESVLMRSKYIAKILRSKFILIALLVLISGLTYAVTNDTFYEWFHYDRHFGIGIDETYFSRPLVQFLNANKISGHVFNQFEIGGYLMWERPTEENFIDSRNLSDSLAKEYYWILQLQPGFENKITNHQIDYMVFFLPELSRNPQTMKLTPIAYLTLNHDLWKLVYWDDVSLVYLKNIPKFHECIAQHEYRILHPFLLSYGTWMLDSLRKAAPADFRNEVERKVREEPNGFIANLFVLYSQTAVGQR